MKAKSPRKRSQVTKLPRRRKAKAVKDTADVMSRLGTTLQERRVALGLTQRRFAELCDLQVATIGKIEAGDPGVKLGTLRVYLNLLNMTLLAVDAADLEDD